MHRLTAIKYFDEIYVYSVTFEFSGDVHSPPYGSYRDEPNEVVEVPFELNTLVFGIREHDG